MLPARTETCRCLHGQLRQPLLGKSGPLRREAGDGVPLETVAGIAGALLEGVPWTGGSGVAGTCLGPLPRCRAPSASASARIPNAPLLPFFGPQKKVFKWQKLAEALKIIIWVVLTKFLLSLNRTPSLLPSVEPQSCLRGVQGTIVLEDGFVAVPTHHCPPPHPRILVRGRKGAGNVTLPNWRGHFLMGRIHRGLWHMCS